jgi:hypothetical protein
MAHKFRKEIATWYFNIKDKEALNSNKIQLLSFGIFSQYLGILQEHQIFVLTSIRPHLIGGIEDEIDVENWSSIQVLSLLDDLINNHDKDTFFLRGKTLIKTNDGDIWEKDIVIFGYDFNLINLHISIYSDVWLPVDYRWNLQIDTAELNYGRLNKTLKKIKALGFNDLMPDEGEDYRDEYYPQHGFNIFLSDDILDYVDDADKLSEDNVNIIQKYLWSNRTQSASASSN